MPPDSARSVEGRPVRNVILTGFMGSGKSTVGRALGLRLGFEPIDTDLLIEARHGPIERIFAERGEDGFRAIERELAAELADRAGLVISTGGRMMLDPANVAALRLASPIFCLVARPDETLRRVMNDDSGLVRPLLAGPDPRARIVELLAERGPAYRRFPRVATDGRAPDDIAAEVEVLASTPSRCIATGPDGAGSVVVGVALLAFVEELVSLDRPLVVVVDEASVELAAGAPSADEVVVAADRPGAPRVVPTPMPGTGTVLALGGAGLVDAAVASVARGDTTGRLLLVPTDLPGVERATAVVGGGVREVATATVLVDVALLQANETGPPPPGSLASLVDRLAVQLAASTPPAGDR